MPAKSKEGLIPIKKLVSSKKRGRYVQTFWITPEQREAQKKAKSKSTKELHTNKSGTYTPEREKLHDSLVFRTMTRCSVPPKGEKPTCILLLGGAASGKSTVVKKYIEPKLKNRFGVINADDYKDAIPEYENFKRSNVIEAASKVHEESSDITKEALNGVIDMGGNFIYDGTLSDDKKVGSLIKKLKENGYNIKLIGVTVDIDDAINRAEKRALGDWEQGGDKPGSARYVPKKVIVEAHKGSTVVFEKYMDKVDSAELYDNNVPLGADPIKVLNKDKEEKVPEVLHEIRYKKFLDKKTYSKIIKATLKNLIQKGKELFSKRDDDELTDFDISRINLNVQTKLKKSLEANMEKLHKEFENISVLFESEINEAKSLIEKSDSDQAIANLNYIKKRYNNYTDNHLNKVLEIQKSLDEAKDKFENSLFSHIELLEKANTQFLGYGDFKYKDYLKNSYGRKRETMPQISKDSLDYILIHFSGKSPKSKIEKVKRKLSDLKPAQKDFNEEKILAILHRGGINKKDSFIISKDNFLIDGTHRFAAGLEMDENQEVDCYRINLPIGELLRRANLLKITKKKDVNDRIVKSELVNQ